MKKATNLNLEMQFDSRLRISADGFLPLLCEDGDFWRMHLDYQASGLERDLGIYSHSQTPSEVVESDDCMVIKYDSLVDERGAKHEISLTLTVKNCGGVLDFSAEIKNDGCARVNELQYPMFEFKQIKGDLEQDVLYMPKGLGDKVVNPYADTAKAHTEYMAADYKNINKASLYPGEMSMPWFGIQSEDIFFYMASQADKVRIRSFVRSIEPRECDEKRFIMSIASYPAVRTGETVVYDGFKVAAFDGDWRSAADYYRAWADASWFQNYTKKDSIRKLNGWQRIILKHQHGEIYHKYDELPQIYKEGAKYGINMILLFAWWEEGMDNGYPNYQPARDLGGAKALKQAIKEINELGGTVVLYANGHIIDVSTDYYRTEGYRYTMKDIELNEYREFYKFSNNGTLLRMGGLKTFVSGCHGAHQWRDKIVEIAKRHLSLGSNGTFFDQLASGMRICFDNTHEHGNRIDEDPHYRLKCIEQVKNVLSEDEIFGTEWVVDRICAYMDFIHGCGNAVYFAEGAYPYIFRYTFPEIPVSNRLIHDEKEGWQRYLNYAFVHGLLYDVAIYRCRAESIENVPNYARYLGKLISLKNQYADFFTDGKYDLSELTDQNIVSVKYTYRDKEIMAVWNDSQKTFVMPYGLDEGKTVAAGDVAIFRVK